MAVTIDRFELLPGAAPAGDPAASAGGSASAHQDGAAPPPPSRHEIVRALRLELSRQARVRAH